MVGDGWNVSYAFCSSGVVFNFAFMLHSCGDQITLGQGCGDGVCPCWLR